LLISDPASGPEAMAKLKILEETTDGFAIAEADLRLRGAGDILGTAQSGLPPLKIANLLLDADLMQRARTAARDILARDPELKALDNQRFQHLLVESKSPLLAHGN
jgi:ATP-dependent DNA helicase RecG